MVKKTRYKRVIKKQTLARIYPEDLAYFRNKFPELSTVEIFRRLRKKC